MRIAFISQQFDAVRGGSSLFGDVFSIIGPQHDIVLFAREDRYQRKSWSTVLVKAWKGFRVPWLNEESFSYAVTQAVRKAHAKYPFDIIVVNQTTGRSIRALRKLGVPVMYVIHHPVSVDRNLAIAESDSLFERMQWVWRYGPMVRTQRMLARSLPVITVSYAAAERIAADYHVPLNQIHIILNGINTDFFQKTVPTQSKTVLAVGSYQHPRRGFRYLAQAYRALAGQGFTILDVGRRTDQQDVVLRGISGIQIYELVRTQEELRDLYSRASVVISTSLYEGFGLSLAEALSCGTPVVAFDAGGVRDVLGVVDGDLLCPLRDVAGLVARVIEIDARPDRQEWARLYRESVVAHFSLERMAREYEAYLASVCKK